MEVPLFRDGDYVINTKGTVLQIDGDPIWRKDLGDYEYIAVGTLGKPYVVLEKHVRRYVTRCNLL